MKKLTNILAVFGLVTVIHAQNLLTNGSFELPVVATGSATNFSGAFSIPGWTGYATGNGISSSAGIVNGGVLGPFPLDGDQTFTPDGGNPPPGSYIQQTFSTTVGKSYLVTYGLYRYNDQTGSNLLMEAQIFDQNTNVLLSVYSRATGAWTYASEKFTATTTNSTLRFTDVSSSGLNTDTSIDNVSVVEIDPMPQVTVTTVKAIKVEGTVGVTYAIQVSNDYSNWTTVDTIILNKSPFLWIDQNTSDQAAYYKVVTP